MGNQPSATGAGSTGAAGASAASSSTPVNYTSVQANGTGTQTQARKSAGSKVILNVYEPSKPQSQMPGFGVYHTGIQFSSQEYSFAGGPDAGSGTGVMSQTPQATPAGGDWKFKQAIELGEVNVDYKEFDRVLQELKDAFPANTYDLIHRNCNHFTTAVAKRLGVHGNYPSWVNRAASWGSVFTAPPKNHQPIVAPPPKESVFKSTAGYRMDGGKTVNPKAATASPAAASSSSASSAKPAAVVAKPVDPKKATAAGGARRNPWADPSFVPPQMRKDPVVATGKI